MTTTELRKLEEERAAARPAREPRVVHRDLKPRNIRAEVEAELRASGVRKIFREERVR